MTKFKVDLLIRSSFSNRFLLDSMYHNILHRMVPNFCRVLFWQRNIEELSHVLLLLFKLFHSSFLWQWFKCYLHITVLIGWIHNIVSVDSLCLCRSQKLFIFLICVFLWDWWEILDSLRKRSDLRQADQWASIWALFYQRLNIFILLAVSFSRFRIILNNGESTNT